MPMPEMFPEMRANFPLPKTVQYCLKILKPTTMKKTTLTIAIFLSFIFQSSAQNNPVLNLTWDWHYNWYNYFDLHWDEPALPHGELIGYNIYRGDELYRFQTGNDLYFLEQGSNCGEDFQYYNNMHGFSAHVTAVYNPGQLESSYTQTVAVGPPALKTVGFEKQKAVLYPNPTKGILNIANTDLNRILIYDISGKKIREVGPQLQIDLSDVLKGIYFVKLVSDRGVVVDKIVVE
jgi:hypothetical protein